MKVLHFIFKDNARDSHLDVLAMKRGEAVNSQKASIEAHKQCEMRVRVPPAHSLAMHVMTMLMVRELGKVYLLPA